MTHQERHIARILFRSKVFHSDGQAYEDLFVRIMQHANSNFNPVKSQGSHGDKKNDGFDDNIGEYFQVYAPEEITGKEEKVLLKLSEDLSGLLAYWKPKGFIIKKHNFVINDKYKGAYPSLYSHAKALGKSNNIECEIFLCRSLEDVFMGLSEEDMNDIVGIIPDGLDIQSPDYDVMTEVIQYLLKTEVKPIREFIPTNPDFERKIIFNALSSPVGILLNAGRRQHFAIRDYFELNSNFLKDELREIFQTIYRKGEELIPESNTKNDDIFQYIVTKSSPYSNLAAITAIYVLMAYYFEYCDIFEIPN